MKILLIILTIIVTSNLYVVAQEENSNIDSIQMEKAVSEDLISNLSSALELISTDKKQAIVILKASIPDLKNVKSENGKRTSKFADIAKRVIQLIKAKKNINAETQLNQLITSLNLLNSM